VASKNEVIELLSSGEDEVIDLMESSSEDQTSVISATDWNAPQNRAQNAIDYDSSDDEMAMIVEDRQFNEPKKEHAGFERITLPKSPPRMPPQPALKQLPQESFLKPPSSIAVKKESPEYQKRPKLPAAPQAQLRRAPAMGRSARALQKADVEPPPAKPQATHDTQLRESLAESFRSLTKPPPLELKPPPPIAAAKLQTAGEESAEQSPRLHSSQSSALHSSQSSKHLQDSTSEWTRGEDSSLQGGGGTECAEDYDIELDDEFGFDSKPTVYEDFGLNVKPAADIEKPATLVDFTFEDDSVLSEELFAQKRRTRRQATKRTRRRRRPTKPSHLDQFEGPLYSDSEYDYFSDESLDDDVVGNLPYAMTVVDHLTVRGEDEHGRQTMHITTHSGDDSKYVWPFYLCEKRVSQ
jgi:hypothetical protein